ncbi:MAG: hypothetical protein K6G25_03575 [Bacteroidales bacterium]|nr:hypothetical protein [Bacteroidales bacterium]
MKKLALTIAILGLGISGFAQGSMFNRQSNAENGSSGNVYYSESKVNRDGEVGLLNGIPGMPGHGETDDQPGQGAPLGSGIVLLAGLGAAYLVGKRRNED